MINVDNAKKIYAALKKAGVKNNTMPILMAQVAHETGGYNSKVFQSDNNGSGIMFINNSQKQKNAVRGKAFPKKEGNANYARFKTLYDWAIDYIRILGNTAQKSTSLTDFATRLKNRKYYTADTNLYAKSLIYWKKKNDELKLIIDQKENSGVLPLILFCGFIAGVYIYTSK